MSSWGKLQAVLAEHGYKVTTARKQVYSALANATQPLCNSEIINNVSGIDKVSVYRTLELYESIGISHRVWNGFKSKVELSDSFSPHHHHFTCDTCGKVISFRNKDIEKLLHSAEATLNVSIRHHVVELSGVCKDCEI